MAAWRTRPKETASQSPLQSEALSHVPRPGDTVSSLKSLGHALTQSEKDSEEVTWAFCDIH